MFEHAMTYKDFQKLSTQEQKEIFYKGYCIWFCVDCEESTLYKVISTSKKPKQSKPVDICTICGLEHVRTR